MALWQFDFNLIPEEKVTGIINAFDVNEDSFEELISWEKYTLSESSIKELSQVLNPTKSWSDSIKQFGSIEGTCIKLLFEENILNEVSVRLNLKENTIEDLKIIIRFAEANNAMIITKKGILIKPSINSMIEEIKKSKAYSFVKNPTEFFSSLEG